jgi:hypothetical protein
MNVQQIVKQLKLRLGSIDRAIAALQRTSGTTHSVSKPRRKMSADGRARIAAAARRRWAAAKKAGKSTLAGK